MAKKERPTYEEQLQEQMAKARRARDAEAYVYYAGNIGTTSACASFATYKGCQAYHGWLVRNQGKIDEVKRNWRT